MISTKLQQKKTKTIGKKNIKKQTKDDATSAAVVDGDTHVSG